MPRFLNTKGQPTLGIGICQRCQTKRRLADLVEDGNIKKFYVCDPLLSPGCWDNFDPFRLPAPPPDRMELPFVRPDNDITIHPDGLPPIGPPFVPSPEAPVPMLALVVTEDNRVMTTEGGVPLALGLGEVIDG